MIRRCLYKLNHSTARKEQPVSDLIQENAMPLLTSHNSPTPEHSLLNREFRSVLEHALQKMPVSQRSVFVLRQVEGFSIAETAELLNISAVNVKVRLNRVKTMLQQYREQLYSSAEIYEFNRVYCDKITNRVFKKILEDASK